jgi:hypothetical protein
VTPEKPQEHGVRRSSGRIRLIEAPRANAWNELTENEINDALIAIDNFTGIPETGDM